MSLFESLFEALNGDDVRYVAVLDSTHDRVASIDDLIALKRLADRDVDRWIWRRSKEIRKRKSGSNQ